MPLFGRSPAGAPRDPQRERRDREAIEAGGLPGEALERLRAQAGGLFTSDLTVGEFAAALRDGWRPLGLVMGSSVYRVNWQSALASLAYGGGSLFGAGYAVPAGGEIEPLSRAAQDCRRRALHRLELEAEALGAHGAVGVRLMRSAWDWGVGLAEFRAVGTAVRLPGSEPLPHPFAGALSGTDAYKLLRAGYAPHAIVGGACLYYVSGLEAAAAGYSFANTPLAATSQAVASARELAVRRLRAEAAALGADGAMGVRVEVYDEHIEADNPQRTDHLLEVYALGTAVARLKAGRGGGSPSVRAAVDLSD